MLHEQEAPILFCSSTSQSEPSQACASFLIRTHNRLPSNRKPEFL